MRFTRLREVTLICTLPLVSGCIMPEGSLGSAAGRLGLPYGQTNQDAAGKSNSSQSQIIDQLQSRWSILPPDSSYAQVAEAVLASDAQVAAAELSAAKLRSKAASKNWLPSLGSVVSLTSLGDMVANLVLDQVLFDNGRAKAQRAFAAADVEMAAATLSLDTNGRVYQALDLYLQAQKGDEVAHQSDVVLAEMKKFQWIMNERVKGGVSDMSDLNILNQKLAEIKAERSRGGQNRRSALAELEAIAARPLDAIDGETEIEISGSEVTPLSVLEAQASQRRDIASAKIDRSSELPSLVASASGGTSDPALEIGVQSDRFFDFGTSARLRAGKAAQTVANRQVEQAKETANRRMQAYLQDLTSAKRQLSEAQALRKQAWNNFTLFHRQYEAGQRQVMDVVGVYESYARQQRRLLEIKYQIAQLKLQIARDLGLLADGAKI
ncbi:MAG: transporter [Marinovum sp.]|nr:transporter [Marinovum sp.]